jgi:RNA polymerase sigma factor (sigma-70 family)
MEHDAAMASRVLGDPLLARVESTPVFDIDLLYRTHRVRLSRLAAAITLDRSLGEEVVHDAFAGLHRRRATVANPEGYLQRSVVNLSIKVLRRRVVASQHRLEPAPLTNVPEIDETWIAVTRLPARQRAVVALRYWDDLSEAEIAGVLGWPRGTVKSTLHRALRRLKEELQP